MRFWLLLPLVLLPRIAVAQPTDTTRRAPGATVSGVVRDSVTRTVIAGAMVQLVAADTLARIGRAAVSDSLGRFALGDVPAGRYMLGFFHPILDSLGLEPTLREVYVGDHRQVRADLAVPSPARLRAAICGARLPLDSGAVVIGVVLDARARVPVAGAIVSAEWLEFALKREGLVRHLPHLVATTRENGWFAMCGVPSPGTIALIASRGADSTGRIELQIPAHGFLKRELYLGAARTFITSDSTLLADTLSRSSRRLRVGNGRLSGTVVTAAEQYPLAGAQVGITDGPQTRANERGEWTLMDAPVGTRMLEVHAMGYYPVRRRVDIVAGAAPVRIALSTFKAVLDTLRVTASRLDDRNRSGFDERRHRGGGHFVTREDIARRQPLLASDLFRTMPGIRLVSDATRTDSRIVLRGCSPNFYLNGSYIAGGLSAADIDAWAHPEEVDGIEIYGESEAPAEYQQGRTGCGIILIWTRSATRDPSL